MLARFGAGRRPSAMVETMSQHSGGALACLAVPEAA